MLFVGVEDEDGTKQVLGSPVKSPTYAASKTRTGKMNRSIHDVNGSAPSISQFTLYADVRKGKRPSFVKAVERPRTPNRHGTDSTTPCAHKDWK